MNLHDEIKAIIAINTPGQVSETNRRLSIILDLLPPKLCLAPKPDPVKKLFCYDLGGEIVRIVAYDLREADRYYDAFVYENDRIPRKEHADAGWEPDLVWVHKEDDLLTIRDEEDGKSETKTVYCWLECSPCGFFSTTLY